jgi:hypothetical protein
MLLNALLSHFARLVIGIQPVLNEFQDSNFEQNVGIHGLSSAK